MKIIRLYQCLREALHYHTEMFSITHYKLKIWLSILICIFSQECLSIPLSYITKTRLFKYTENFISKSWTFSDKKTDVFHTFSQNVDCEYSLEPPLRGGSNEYHNLCF